MSEESANDYEYTDNDDSLKQFLLTGEIGTLGSQPSMSAVRTILGEPDHTESMPDVVPDQLLTVLHYDNLEIVYLDDEFLKFKISFQVEDELDFATELGIKWYTFLAQMDYRSFKAFVIQNQIECREVLFPFLVEETGYVIEIRATKMWLIFDPPPSCKIQSVSYEPSLSGKWNYKPISE